MAGGIWCSVCCRIWLIQTTSGTHVYFSCYILVLTWFHGMLFGLQQGFTDVHCNVDLVRFIVCIASWSHALFCCWINYLLGLMQVGFSSRSMLIAARVQFML